jgi:hypothetical protein
MAAALFEQSTEFGSTFSADLQKKTKESKTKKPEHGELNNNNSSNNSWSGCQSKKFYVRNAEKENDCSHGFHR